MSGFQTDNDDIQIKALVNDTSPPTIAEGANAVVRMTPLSGQHVNLRNQAGTEIATSTNPARIDPTGTTTQPISAVSLPLPTGASTSALQTTANTSLSSIDTKTPALGQTTMAASQPITIASNQSSIPVTISPGDVAPATQSITTVDTATSNLSGANGQVFYFGTPTTNSAAIFALSSIANVNVESSIIGAGGTLVVEVSTDNGSFWFRPNVFQFATQNYTNAFTAPFSATLNVSGMTHVRVRAITSWTGNGTITVRETTNNKSVIIGESLPSGANTIGAVTQGTSPWVTSRNWTLSSGTDSIAATQSGTWNITNISGTISLPTGASTSALQTTGNTLLSSIDTKTPALGQTTMSASQPVVIASNQTAVPISGTVNTVPVDGIKTSYSACINGLVTAALATDVLTITGSATKTVRITQIQISGTTTSGSGADINLSLIKRSSANTGGTTSTLTNVPMDSTNPAATAVVKSYTVNPTVLGTTVGNIRTSRFQVPVVGADGFEPEFNFGSRPAQAIVLRGTSEILAINFGVITITGPIFSISVEFTEE